MTDLKLTEWLGLTGAGIKVFGDIDWNKKGAAATGQGIVRVLVCYVKILEEKKWSLSARLQCLVSASHLQGLGHHHCCCCYCWTVDLMI